jgi:hypothetical protein
MVTITLYECDLCYLVQDFYSLSKLLGGGGSPPLVSATAIRLRRAFSVFAERNFFSYLYPNFYSERNFYSKL